MLDISIVTHNSSKDLSPLIESIIRQDLDLKQISLYFQDNGSSDQTVELLNRLLEKHRHSFQHVEIIQSSDVGFGKGHNSIIFRGKNPYVFVLNPDAVLYRDTLTLLLDRAKSDSEEAAAWEPRQLPYEHPKCYDPVTLETPWMSGAAFLIRRSVFEQVCGFEPRIFLYGEDVDLSFRIRSLGYKIIYYPKSSFRHHTYGKAGDVKPHQFLGTTLANLYLRTRFGSWWDIANGVLLYFYCFLKALILQKPCRGLSWGMVKNFGQWLSNFVYFRKSRCRALSVKFRSLEYTQMRIGSFYESVYVSDITLKPKISVLIRTIGRQSLLRMAIKSVINQVYSNFEIVVVEDGGETLRSFLAEFKNVNIIYKSTAAKAGRCETGNAAMRTATGDYFIFLDEDDLFFPDHLEQLMSAIQKTGYKIAYSLAFEVPSEIDKGSGQIVKEGAYQNTFTSDFSFFKLLHYNYIPINVVLFARSLFDEIGGFDVHLTHHEDWLLWVKYSAKARPFAFVQKTTALYRVPLNQIDYKKRQAVLLSSYQQVLQRCSSMKVEMTMEELLKACREMTSGKFILREAYLRFLVGTINRFPFLSTPLRRGAKLARRLLPRRR